MKKSVLKIIISIIIIMLLYIIITSMFSGLLKQENTIEKKSITINIKENSIIVQENMDIKISKNTKLLKANDFVHNNGIVKTFKVDGKYCGSIKNESGLDIYKNVELIYEINGIEIKKYNDISILKFCISPKAFDNHVQNIDIKVKFDKPNSYFNVERDSIFKNIKFDKISDTEFKLHINKWNNTYIYLHFDNDQTQIGKTVNNSYYEELREELREETEEYIRNNKLDINILGCFLVTFISYIII